MTPESKAGIAEINKRDPGTYKIREIFYSLQGEGPDVGRAAVFVRFSHCNLSCAWCDTDYDVKGFWFTGPQILFEAEQAMLRANLKSAVSPMVVFTGGEPTLQVDLALLDQFAGKFPFLAIETNGIVKPPAFFDRIVVSPKTPTGWWWTAVGDDEKHRDEVALKVVLDPSNPHMPTILSRAEEVAAPGCLFLSPLEDQKTKETNVKDCIAFVLSNPRWRLSLQTHKALGLR